MQSIFRFVLETTAMPSLATGTSLYSTPPFSQSGTSSSSLIGREASEMSVSPAQNFSKPPPVPEVPTVIFTPGFSAWKFSAAAWVNGATVLDPSILILPPRSPPPLLALALPPLSSSPQAAAPNARAPHAAMEMMIFFMPATLASASGQSVIRLWPWCEKAVNAALWSGHPPRLRDDGGSANRDPRLGLGVRASPGEASGGPRLAVQVPRVPAADRRIRCHARERASGRPRPARSRRVGVPGAGGRGASGHGNRRLHRPLDRGSARARPARRRRRLVDEAVPSGGGARACGGRRAAPEAGVRARGLRSARGGRARDPCRPVPGVRPRAERGPDPARVRAPRAAGAGRGQGAPARGDLPGRLGIHDGPRRPLRGRVRPKAAPEARERVARLGLHPHALRRGLPLRARAAGWVRGAPGLRGDRSGGASTGP